MAPSSPSRPTAARVLDWLDAQTDRLVATADGLSASDLGGRSRCAGWSRGHVVTHVARNAEGIANLTRWALTGVPTEMYPGGQAARDAAIEAGAGRGPAEQVRDLRETARTTQGLLVRLASEGAAVDIVEGRGGVPVRSDALATMRLREVVFHHVDLDTGFSFADVEDGLLDVFLDDAVRRQTAAGLSTTLDTGDRTWTVGDGGAAVTGSRSALLLWLARQDTTGVRSDDPLPTIPEGN